MQALLAFLGVILLVLCIWFLGDYGSFSTAAAKAHQALSKRRDPVPATAVYGGQTYLLVPRQ